MVEVLVGGLIGDGTLRQGLMGSVKITRGTASGGPLVVICFPVLCYDCDAILFEALLGAGLMLVSCL